MKLPAIKLGYRSRNFSKLKSIPSLLIWKLSRFNKHISHSPPAIWSIQCYNVPRKIQPIRSQENLYILRYNKQYSHFPVITCAQYLYYIIVTGFVPRLWVMTLWKIFAVDTQFKQLRKRSLKKIQASAGFEPVTSAIPVQCSTNWAMKP